MHELPGHSDLQIKANYGREITYTRIAVVVKRLDDLIEERKIDGSRLAMIKFDLEGGELHALQGAQRSIMAGRPLIMFEYGNLEAYANNSNDFIEFFSRCNYQMVDSFGYYVNTNEELLGFIGWNNFAVPIDKIEKKHFLDQLIATRLQSFIKSSPCLAENYTHAT